MRTRAKSKVEERCLTILKIKKITAYESAMADYSVQRATELFLDLPWNEYTKDNFDLDKAKKILDRDHFGLEKVKERILEYLAVLNLRAI